MMINGTSTMDAERGGLFMLLAHVIRIPEVADAACVHLYQQNPFENHEDLTIIWNTTKEYWKNFGKAQNQTISKEWLLTDLKSRLCLCPLAHTPTADVEATVDGLFAIPESGLNKHIAAEILTRLKDDRILGRVREALNNGSDSDDVIEVVRQAQHSLGLSVLSRPIVMDNVLGDNFLNRIVSLSRDPIGVPFIDSMLGGGMAAREKACFIIPTGCGKTTMGLQISDAKVTADEVVAYVQTEQELDGDLQQRICTLASGSSKKVWESLADAIRDGDKTATLEKYLKPQELDRFQKMLPKWNQNFWFFDFTDAIRSPLRSVDQIFQAIADKENVTGRKVHTVIIDWWGRITDRIAAQSTGDGAQVRLLNRTNMDILKGYCNTKNYRCIVYHQTAGAKISTKKAASANNAQEDTNFPQLFDYAFAMTQLNDRSEGMMTAAKVRRGSRNSVKVVLDGEHAKFKGQDEMKKSVITTMKQENKDILF